MRRRWIRAAAAFALGSAMLVGGAPSPAQEPGAERPPSASSELQEAYPLRQSVRCCANPAASSAPAARPPAAVGETPRLREPGDDGGALPMVLLAMVAVLSAITLVLGARAVQPAVRRLRLHAWTPTFPRWRPEVRVPRWRPRGSDRVRRLREQAHARRRRWRQRPYDPERRRQPRPRPIHAVSPAVIRLAGPLFRYSYRLDAYVLRGIGTRHGPVLTERDEDNG